MAHPRRHTTPPARYGQDGPLPLRGSGRPQVSPSLAPSLDSNLTYDIDSDPNKPLDSLPPTTHAAILPTRRDFLSRVKPSGGCWLWCGPQHHNGYGYVCDCGNKQPLFTHRVSYQLFVGPIPAGKSVLHRCDVRHCVNPAHLFLGTQADNIEDAKNKGRMARHMPRARTILTSQDVQEMRCMRDTGATYGEIAARFDAAWLTVWRIVHRKTWKHVP